MRVHVYKAIDGELSVLVQPSPGKGRPPVLLAGITSENVVEQVLPIVQELRKPKISRQARLPL